MQIISSQALENSLDRRLLVEALRKGFKEGATVPTRHHHTIKKAEGDATLLLMPAWSTDGLIGIKMVTVFPTNVNKSLPSIYGTYSLLDGTTGIPLALMDGRILTLYRTAAASVLAASYLAHSKASKLLMVGTGALAPHIVLTYVEVLGISEVKIWGRNVQKADALAERLDSGNISVQSCKNLEDGAQWADIISCATLSKNPLIRGSWLRDGTFVDLIGGYTPEMREADDEVVRRASIFVDTKDGALTEAGDIIIPIKKGILQPEDIQGDLFDLATGTHPGRLSDQEICMFKSTGYALEDLVAAQLAYSNLNGYHIDQT